MTGMERIIDRLCNREIEERCHNAMQSEDKRMTDASLKDRIDLGLPKDQTKSMSDQFRGDAGIFATDY